MNSVKVLLVTILFCSLGGSLFGQCNENFTIKKSGSGTVDGKIEIEFEGGKAPYTFKTYQLDSKAIKLVDTKTVRSTEKTVAIEGLVSAYYLIQVEFGSGCKQSIGGLEGILVKSNKDE